MSISPSFQIDAQTAEPMGRSADIKGFQVPYKLDGPQNVNADNPSFQLSVDEKKLNEVKSKFELSNPQPSKGTTHRSTARLRHSHGIGQERYKSLVNQRAPKFAQQARSRLQQAKAGQDATPSAADISSKVSQQQTVSLGQNSPIVAQQLRMQAQASGFNPAMRRRMGAGMLRTMTAGVVAGPVVGTALAAADAVHTAVQPKQAVRPNPVVAQQQMIMRKRNRQFALA